MYLVRTNGRGSEDTSTSDAILAAMRSHRSRWVVAETIVIIAVQRHASPYFNDDAAVFVMHLDEVTGPDSGFETFMRQFSNPRTFSLFLMRNTQFKRVAASGCKDDNDELFRHCVKVLRGGDSEEAVPEAA